MSFGDDPIRLDFTNGLNLITGYNKDIPDIKNGIGKSSICDALIFALFDETLKGLKKGEIVNDRIEKNCEVQLEFAITENGKDIKYHIKRGISPSICTISKNGDDMTKSTIAVTNKYIENAIGITKSLFKQSIILSIGNSESFFSLKKQDKRAFIEGVFDLDIFSKMLGDARQSFNNSKKDKEISSLQIGSESENLKILVEKDNGFENTKLNIINTLEDENIEDLAHIKRLKDSLKRVPSVDAISNELNTLSKLVSEMDVSINSAKSTILNKNRDIVDAKTHITKLESIGDVCVECNRPLEKSELDSRIETILNLKEQIKNTKIFVSKIQDGVEKVTDKRKESYDTYIELKQKIASRDATILSNTTVKNNMEQMASGIRRRVGSIKKTKESVSDFNDLINTSKTQIKELEIAIKDATKENFIYEMCKFILSEEGVKSVIIKELKNFLNVRLNEYLFKLDAPISCTFDEYFEETLYNQYGKKKSFFALSGGERKRLDLAVLFTLQDMLKSRSGHDIRLAFYDEILDTSICESGRRKVLDILKEKSENSAIYVISHRSKMSDIIDQEITLIKHNEYTTIEKGEHSE